MDRNESRIIVDGKGILLVAKELVFVDNVLILQNKLWGKWNDEIKRFDRNEEYAC